MANNHDTDFAKRAENLLQARMETINTLGELMGQRADLDARIEKATQEALHAGWTKKELVELGAPVSRQGSNSRRRPAKKTADASSVPVTHDGNLGETHHFDHDAQPNHG